MQLRVDLSELWRQARRISEQVVEFDVGESGVVLDPIDIELGEGKEVKLDDLEIVNGLLSVAGRQVLLFIPDQFKPIDEVEASPATGTRFHVSDCRTLESMRQSGRFQRYFATNKLDGKFRITGTDSRTGQHGELESELRVCMNCLSKVNYKDYNHHPQRRSVWTQFEIAEFFNTFSTSFKHLPRQIADRPGSGTYTSDWKEISAKVRQECGFRCDGCDLDLSANKHLLHVHHINGVKHDNERSNLRPLCADCHRKQPMHERMFVSLANMATITRLRNAQKLVGDDWGSILDLADLSVHGALSHARHKGFPPPEIGYEFLDEKGVVRSEIEAAWPDRKIGICVGEVPDEHGWQLMDAIGFMESHG